MIATIASRGILSYLSCCLEGVKDRHVCFLLMNDKIFVGHVTAA